MLWGVTTTFNPAGFERPLANLETFAARARAQGLPLMIVELAIGDDDFAVPDEWADIVVRLRSDQVLWFKESLINVGVRRLPDDCDRVVWLDADVLFENDDWVARTSEALDEHRVVQPFSHCVWLPYGTERVDDAVTAYPAATTEFARLHSFGFGWSNFGEHALEARLLYGQVGFAWAARRSVLEEVPLYDAAVIGGGDDLVAHGFVGCETLLRTDGWKYPPGVLEDYRRWADRARAVVEGDVGYVDGTLFHLWHGSYADRRYVDRFAVLRDAAFDPARHLTRHGDGLIGLREPPSGLADGIRDHFSRRREDAAPTHEPVCSHREGFHPDEGQFRWAQQEAAVRIVRDVDDWTITVSNNAQDRFVRPQQIVIARNGATVAEVLLPDTRPVAVPIGGVRTGDEVTFSSSFSFRPEAFGDDDTRSLSFMLWNEGSR